MYVAAEKDGGCRACGGGGCTEACGTGHFQTPLTSTVSKKVKERVRWFLLSYFFSFFRFTVQRKDHKTTPGGVHYSDEGLFECVCWAPKSLVVVL